MEGIICNICKRMITGKYLHLELKQIVPMGVIIHTIPKLMKPGTYRHKVGLDFCTKECLLNFIEMENKKHKRGKNALKI